MKKIAVFFLFITLSLQMINFQSVRGQEVCDSFPCKIILDETGIVNVGSKTYTAVEDAYTDSKNPGTNYGSSTSLYAYSFSSAYKYSYIKFISKSMYMPIISIYSATAYIYVSYASGSDNRYYSYITSDWAENTITYNNAPSSTGIYNMVISTTGWYSISLSTSSVRKMFTGSYFGMLFGTFSQSSQSYYYTISSRETSNKPYLVVTDYSYSVMKTLMVVKSGNSITISFSTDTYPSDLTKTDLKVMFDIVKFYANGNTTITNQNATYSTSSNAWVYTFTPDTNFIIKNIRLTYKDAIYHTYPYDILVRIIYGNPVILQPMPNSVNYNSLLNVTLTNLLGYKTNLTVLCPNGTKKIINFTSTTLTLSKNVKFVEGRNWLQLQYIMLSSQQCTNTTPFWIIVDEYRPSKPTILKPSDKANLTTDLINVSWAHDGFDVEWFDIKAWRYYPYFWATKVTVPAATRWQYVQLAGSGLYYIQVISRDAAGNEASSEIVRVNISSSTIRLKNLTLNRTGFAFTLTNTLNSSQDVTWNLSISLLSGQLIEKRYGVLSFYPNETKSFYMTWNKNLSENVYLAEFWVSDRYGGSSGFMTTFLAIPPFQTQGAIPLSMMQSNWELERVIIGDKPKASSILLISNANHVDSPQQSITFILPANFSTESITVKDKITGTTYSATLNATAGTGSFVVPSIPPYSSRIYEIQAFSSKRITASFTKVDGASGIAFIGNKTYRIYNTSIENPLELDINVILLENETMKWDCPNCAIIDGRLVLTLSPKETKVMKAYFLEERKEELDLTARPLSVFLRFMNSTPLGAFIALIIGVFFPIALAARLELGRRRA